MLSLEPLREDQYRQVAEWEYGPQEDVDWNKYVAEMNAPQWLHLGIYAGAEFVGAISIEQIGRNMAAFHVVTARRKVHPQALADILIQIAGRLFDQGCTALAARIPTDKRAAALLAMRCDMYEYGHTPQMRFFILTKSRYSNGWGQTSSYKSAVSTATADH